MLSGKQFPFADILIPDYYVLISANPLSVDEWLSLPSYISTDKVYCPEGRLEIFTEKYFAQEVGEGSPFRLICLVCFLHILRRENGLCAAVLDGKYSLEVKQWRAPCETTALFVGVGGNYYLEGCRDRGVYWRSEGTVPNTVPPFVSCGALDKNGGCWYQDCPHGLYVADIDEA